MQSVDTFKVAGDYAQTQAKPDSRGKALLALSASLLWPGLGQFLAGRKISGMIFSVLWTCVAVALMEIFQRPEFLPAMIVLLPGALLLMMVQLIHAVWCGGRSTRTMLPEPVARYTAGLALGALAILAYSKGIAYLQNNWFEICYSPTDSMGPAIRPGDLFLNYPQQPFTRWDVVALRSPEEARAAELKEEITQWAKSTGHDVQFTESTVIVDGKSYDLPPPALVKRVVGMPGDKIEITGSALLINDKPVELPPDVGPYIPVDRYQQLLTVPAGSMAAPGCWGNPIRLGSDEYYLLGDNSAASGDSRYFDAVGDHQNGAIPRSFITGRIVARIWPPSRWHIFMSSADAPGAAH
jgi:signal peptidase I